MKVLVDYSYTKTFIVQGEGEFKSKEDAEKMIKEDPADVAEWTLCPSQSSEDILEVKIYDVRDASS